MRFMIEVAIHCQPLQATLKLFEAGAIKNGAVEWMEASKMANQPRSLCVRLARPIATASVATSTMSNSDLGLCL